MSGCTVKRWYRRGANCEVEENEKRPKVGLKFEFGPASKEWGFGPSFDINTALLRRIMFLKEMSIQKGGIGSRSEAFKA